MQPASPAPTAPPPPTTHRAICGDARDLGALPDQSVHLVLTSPPYPMIEMWDAAFVAMDPAVGPALAAQDGPAAFALMHRQLDRVWAECQRVLVDGGLAAINIGDATRSVGAFRLYPNHARILQGAQQAGFQVLPDILWRKPTNAPNKFMGSGMLPAGAYVTYEHEYVLILRKGGPRRFPAAADKRRRQQSAFFWEERNQWFSDLWEGLPGERQTGSAAARQRSAAFPVELAWRLVHMYSLQGDLLLDPFVGTGTTLLAAAAAGRSSVGVDLAPELVAAANASIALAPALGQRRCEQRVAAHRLFVAARLAAGKPTKHHNPYLDLPVVTGQEVALLLPAPTAVAPAGEAQQVSYRWWGG